LQAETVVETPIQLLLQAVAARALAVQAAMRQIYLVEMVG